MQQNIHTSQKAVLAGIECPGEEGSSYETLDELSLLLETAGGVEVGRTLQSRPTADPKTFIGSGKALELKALAEANDADLAVFDTELSPAQKNNLEDVLGIEVLDRSALILDIFASRARTSEGKLQVELAQYEYLLPRLRGKGAELSRLAGGIFTRGPGESKLESDRRHIRARIHKLNEELDEVRRQRGLTRQKREKNEIPVVSIVGYTNAGKSTLANALCGADISAADRLFETLDTTARRLELADGFDAVLTDTVGFIRKLPHHLVKAFRATLEELSHADLILHVIDGSNPEWRTFMQTTDNLAAEFSSAPRLIVFNKSDLGCAEDLPPQNDETIYISAVTGGGLDRLKDAIKLALDKRKHEIRILLPYGKGGLLDTVHSQAIVKSEEYTESGISLHLFCEDALHGKLQEFML